MLLYNQEVLNKAIAITIFEVGNLIGY